MFFCVHIWCWCGHAVFHFEIIVCYYTALPACMPVRCHHLQKCRQRAGSGQERQRQASLLIRRPDPGMQRDTSRLLPKHTTFCLLTSCLPIFLRTMYLELCTLHNLGTHTYTRVPLNLIHNVGGDRWEICFLYNNNVFIFFSCNISKWWHRLLSIV